MRRWAAARPLAVREAPSRQTSVRRTPPDLPCGARPARPLAVHAASFARRVASKPGQALQASHPPPIGQSHPMSGTKLPLLRTSNAQPGQNSPHTKPRRIEPVQNSPSRRPRWTHPGQNSPNTPQNGDTKPFLACRENFFTPTAEASRAGRTLYRTQDHLRDKTLPAQLISRSNGTKFSPLVIKRSFWPVLRMQGEFYPGYDIRGPQQGEFYPGILVALGLHPGSAMIIHVLLARQRP